MRRPERIAGVPYAVRPGPGKLRRRSAPASRGHDDLLTSTALTVRLERRELEVGKDEQRLIADSR